MLHFLGDAGRVAEIQHRIALVAKEHALKIRRQKSARPQRRAAAESAPGGEHNVARQILRHAAQAVIEPRTHAGPAKQRHPAIHHQLAGMMIELIGVQRADQRDVVCARAEMREQFR